MSNEKQTRKLLIDHHLREAGWNVNNPLQVSSEFLVKTGVLSEPGASYENTFSDYALFNKQGKVLAIVEAKSTSKDSRIGQEQAKQYCLNIEQQTGFLPFCLYTNGIDIYFWNIGQYPPKKIISFPTRNDLEKLEQIRRRKKSLATELINVDTAGRDYQIAAIRSVFEALEQKRTKLLLVMATGTGKTRTCIAMVDALMKAQWVQKVLFLVDRIALQEQAIEAFKEHLPNEPYWPHKDEKAFNDSRRIYVSTYPSMLNIIKDHNSRLSPHFFDLIVIDESHRSIYNTYQEILNYFNTITLGLTATPTDRIDHNTFKLFECEDELPTFAYSYEEAVKNQPPYLCDFDVLDISTKFLDRGINRDTIIDEDIKKLAAKGRHADDIEYKGKHLEKIVRNKGTNALIVKTFMDECIKDPYGVVPGKTIFFCQNIAQARQMDEIFDMLYPEYNGELSKVLVSEDPRVYGKGGLLDQFKRNDMPRVAISVDMLDTGVDVREIVNLVFAKPVFSYTKFWQMIGRGTRLLEPTSMKVWCEKKDRFLIMDCWKNFKYFGENRQGKSYKSSTPLPQRFAESRIDKISHALELDEIDIAFKEVNLFRDMLKALPQDSITIRDAQSKIIKVLDAKFWEGLSAMALDFLREEIIPLFVTMSQVDFDAMRFEKMVLECSTSYLISDEAKYAIEKDAIIEQVDLLPLSVNVVERKKQTIKAITSGKYFKDIKDVDFDTLSRKLAPLMRFIDKTPGGTGMDHLNLKDEITKREFIEFGPENESVSITRYKEMVEERIAQMVQDNTILQKIKHGKYVTPVEAEQLADELLNEDPHITLSHLKRIYQNQRASLVQFIKHIMGIELLESFDITVANKINDFIAQHNTLNTNQIEFLKLLGNVIIERGKIERRNLLEAPFTVIDPRGIQGVFAPHEIKEVLELTEKLVA
ncbi:MAG: DEAD/DEAH box helicase family protein [Nonlabens sp.]